MDTLLKGRSTEAAVLNAFAQRDHPVAVPFGDGQPYDLVVDLGTAALRVQCKTARAYSGGLMFNCRSTDHGRGPASYIGLADAFGVYFPGNQQVYVVPVLGTTCTKAILRLEPTRNNQRLRVRMAVDYEIDRWSDEELRELCGMRFQAGVELAA
ncbi:MAG: group I intron-associated PD-(D/E)XK endonuclease [Solirubrobacterales bacterium]